MIRRSKGFLLGISAELWDERRVEYRLDIEVASCVTNVLGVKLKEETGRSD